ncbi:hypothetical protein CR513_29538, partial [Mucuna pruriens]
MEDETSGNGSTLILGGTVLDDYMLERFQWNLFNIFEAMKHPTEDYSLFGIDLIEELVEEYFQLDNHSEDMENFVENRFHQFLRAEQKAESDSIPARTIPVRRSRPKYPKAEVMTAHLVSSSSQDAQPDPKVSTTNSSSPPPPMELKPLQNHLKYAYLDNEQQLPVIIANNLHQEQEDKLLDVLRKHKKEIGWKLSDLPSINSSICMHRILMVEEVKPIRQQQKRVNLTILDVVKKEVTKLLAAGIMYPISDSQWVSPVQVVPKKSGMIVMKNQHDEMVPMRI